MFERWAVRISVRDLDALALLLAICGFAAPILQLPAGIALLLVARACHIRSHEPWMTRIELPAIVVGALFCLSGALSTAGFATGGAPAGTWDTMRQQVEALVRVLALAFGVWVVAAIVVRLTDGSGGTG